MTKSKLPIPSESQVQKAVIQLFESCGGVVYRTSQGYRKEPGGTRMTPGLSDLVVFFPSVESFLRRPGKTLFWEVKRPGGKRAPAQEDFGHHAENAESAYGWGGVPEATELLRRWGLVA